jgi:hypothetical protein
MHSILKLAVWLCTLAARKLQTRVQELSTSAGLLRLALTYPQHPWAACPQRVRPATSHTCTQQRATAATLTGAITCCAQSPHHGLKQWWSAALVAWLCSTRSPSKPHRTTFLSGMCQHAFKVHALCWRTCLPRTGRSLLLGYLL